MPISPHWPQGTVFTLGHSTLSAGEFVARLKAYGIERLVDVRTVPRSRYNPQFGSDELAKTLAGEGIDYIHMKELGGLRHPHKDSPNTGWRNEGFRGYADYMQTEEFLAALDRLIAISREKRTAIMCAEAVPWRCHRSLIADALLIRDIPVVEILSDDNHRPHTLTPFAKADGLHLTYPPEQPALF